MTNKQLLAAMASFLNDLPADLRIHGMNGRRAHLEWLIQKELEKERE